MSKASNSTRKSSRADSAQSELDFLQREYRMMEVNRRTYSEDSQNHIRMQRQQIEKLKKDNERLKEDLALETRQAKQANNMSASAQIAKLQDQGDMYTRKIEIEKRRIAELDKQIKKMQGACLRACLRSQEEHPCVSDCGYLDRHRDVCLHDAWVECAVYL